jgi:hypothetical protein
MMEPLTLAALAPLPYWVAWQTEVRRGTKTEKPTKVPYAPQGGEAHADKPHTWGNRPAAEKRAIMLPKPFGIGGVGLEFTSLGDGRSLAGIDLDACRDVDSGKLEAWSEDVIAGIDSYVEVSPSQTGAKAFFTYDTDALDKLRSHMGAAKFSKMFKRAGGDHPPAIELHLGNRYFAVTDDLLPGSRIDLRHVETDRLIRLLTVDGPAFAEAPRTGGKTKRGITGADRSRSSVAFRIGKGLAQDGKTFEQMCEALRADPETADWMREKGDADGQREARRIFDKAKTAGPLIRVVAGEMHHVVTKAEDALIAAAVPLYQRGPSLVRPASRDVPAAHGRVTLAAGMAEVNPHALIDILCGVAEWERFDARAEAWLRITPPRQVADILLSRYGQWRVPHVAGVVTTPTMRADGSILSAPGYDPSTRLYHVADPSLKLQAAVAHPTREHAVVALKALTDLLAEFPFVLTKINGQPDQAISLAVALSALITPVVRGALPVAPAHAFRANTAGSGKSYLADTASAIATGRPCPVISAAPGDEAETEKRITGLLLAGFGIISLDNVNGELGGDLLCQAIERPLVRVRPLGRSDIVEIESRSTIFVTGNNLQVRGDMVRRTLPCDLDPAMERPEERPFKGDPVATILADRGRYVSAALIIVRAYMLAGSPDKLTPIASFEEWSDRVRSALVWLGCADPALAMKAARDDDPELSDLREVMAAWRETFGSAPTTCRDAITAAEEKVASADEYGNVSQYAAKTELRFPDLNDVLQRVAGFRGTLDPSRLGRWLMARKGRIVDRERFNRGGLTNGAARWILDTASPRQ